MVWTYIALFFTYTGTQSTLTLTLTQHCCSFMHSCKQSHTHTFTHWWQLEVQWHVFRVDVWLEEPGINPPISRLASNWLACWYALTFFFNVVLIWVVSLTSSLWSPSHTGTWDCLWKQREYNQSMVAHRGKTRTKGKSSNKKMCCK